MRVQSDPWFLDYLLRIGNGTEDTFVGHYVRLPKYIVIEYKDEHSIDRLIDCVFPDLNSNACSTQYMHERGILCTRNDYVDAINARMIDRFLGKATVFYSFDSVGDDERNNYPQDFLNSTMVFYNFDSVGDDELNNYPQDFLNSITPNVCRCMSSVSKSIVPLLSSIIWTRVVVYAMELVWLSGQSISIY
jgi:hypothetical protein